MWTHTHTLFLPLPVDGHVTLPISGGRAEDESYRVTVWELGLHLCTARPPLLLNLHSHCELCTAPFCSCTGFILSSLHSCLFNPDCQLNGLHTPHRSPQMVELMAPLSHWDT